MRTSSNCEYVVPGANNIFKKTAALSRKKQGEKFPRAAAIKYVIIMAQN